MAFPTGWNSKHKLTIDRQLSSVFMFDWFFDGFIKSPTKQTKPGPESIVVNSSQNRPVHKTKFFASIGIVFITPVVAILLVSSSPATVFSGISRTVIDSVQTMFSGWPFSHISIETLKVIPPFWAYVYSSTAVIFVTGIVFIKTSLFESFPNFVLRRITQSVGRHRFPRNLFLPLTHINNIIILK